jgi:hypothetical protein
VHFAREHVKFNLSALHHYTHCSDETGNRVTTHFCPQCGTTVYVTMEIFPDVISIQGGTYDEPGWLDVSQHIWVRSKAAWLNLPDHAVALDGAPVHPKRSG